VSKLKVGLVQQSCGPDRAANVARSIDGIRRAAAQGARLVALQELHTGPYFCQSEADQYFDLAETIPGPSTEEFGAIARELGIVLVISLFERRAPGLYHNTAVVLEKDGTIAGTYRKMHIPDDPGFYEKFYFTPGDLGFRPIRTSVGKLGVLVCWDQWYPEAARLMALAGADLLIYPTAIGWKKEEPTDEHQRQLDSWVLIQRSHAVANGIPVLSINRTGWEPPLSPERFGLTFWGNSFIAGPQGEFLGQASSDKEEILLAELDLGNTDRVRRAWPFFRDRRIDAYGDLTKRFGE
jgi:N-carbamoylputrescine amidase